LEDFTAVATGEADFETIRSRREFEKWALDKGLNKEQREIVLMVSDFKRANPDITPMQILRSHWLDQAGGAVRVKALFGSSDKLIALADEALALVLGSAIPEED